MEGNSYPTTASGNDSSNIGSASAGSSSTGSSGASSPGSGGGIANDGDQSAADRARSLAGSAQDKLADVGSSVRDRAGHLKESLAGALESGADKLCQRGMSGAQLTADAGTGGVAVEHDGRVAQAATRVASGMDATADWLRDADLDGLKSGLERQVKEHPGRTLLIAAGIGYILGKAFRDK